MKQFKELKATSKFLHSVKYPMGVFGGAARSWYRNTTPRDVDIAIDCTSEELEELIIKSKLSFTVNSFGGFKFYDCVSFDVWPLMETWTLRRVNAEFTFESLARFGSLNVDCLVYDCKRDEIIDRGYFNAINTGFVEINYHANPHAPANALRGLRLCKQLGLKAGESLKEYVKEHITDKNKKLVEARYFKVYHEEPNELWKLLEV